MKVVYYYFPNGEALGTWLKPLVGYEVRRAVRLWLKKVGDPEPTPARIVSLANMVQGVTLEVLDVVASGGIAVCRTLRFASPDATVRLKFLAADVEWLDFTVSETEAKVTFFYSEDHERPTYVAELVVGSDGRLGVRTTNHDVYRVTDDGEEAIAWVASAVKTFNSLLN